LLFFSLAEASTAGAGTLTQLLLLLEELESSSLTRAVKALAASIMEWIFAVGVAAEGAVLLPVDIMVKELMLIVKMKDQTKWMFVTSPRNIMK
jgi:hypothetical protein